VHLVSKKIDTLIGFTRAYSIFDVPCTPSLILGRTTFTVPIFCGGAILDGATWLAAVFAFLATDFFDSSALRFFFHRLEGFGPRKRPRSIGQPHLLKNVI
jgi:hypothetical protein